MERDGARTQQLEKIHEYLSEVSTINEKLLRIPTVNDNPLEKRFRITLENKQTHLAEVLHQIENQPVDSQQFKKSLFVIYHADEVGNLHLGGWKRETKWHEQNESMVEEISDHAKDKKQKLKEATSCLEDVLGEDLKYIIPALYRA